MSESNNTLAGLLALNDQNLSPAVASAILNKAPVLAAIFAQKASQGGTTHKFERELTANGAGFRLNNEGITPGIGTFEIVTQELAILDATVRRDLATAKDYAKGQTAYMDKMAGSSIAQALFVFECAMFRANVNKQFTGLPGNAYFDATVVDGQVIDAGGAGGRSVWLLRSGEDGISALIGYDGKITVGEDVEVSLVDASNRSFPGLQRSILGRAGLQVGCQYDAARIVNLDGTTGHTLTDAHIQDAFMKAKAGLPFNIIAMSRTSLGELWKSRTAVNPTGAEAAMPTSWQGIPIIVTDAIPENEAALNTTTTTTTTSTQA
jgi:hypothetical protein